MWPRCSVGDGTVGWSGTSATHGDRKRGSVVAAAIASREPGSGRSGATCAAAGIAAKQRAARVRKLIEDLRGAKRAFRAAAMIPSRSIPTLDPTRLADLGWNESWASHLAATGAAGRPGRVLVAHRGACIVGTAEDDLPAEPSGTLRREAQSGGLLPAVGDWVVLAVEAPQGRAPASGPATIEHILPRRSAISRKVKGKAAQVQVIAANVDTVFLVSGLDGDFNLRRIERALVAVWDTGAQPVVVLTKSDLSADVEDKVKTVEALAAGVPVHAVSAREGIGLEALDPYRRRGSTIALLGSSGVGKSTLINRLLGWDRQDTGGVREHDSRGRHTTTKRELIVLPDGGVLVDTPGLRELQLWEGEGGLDAVFADVTADAGACRFRDCSHHEEPGCAVRAAWAAGGVTPERVESYRKLQRELEHVASLRDERTRLERSRQEKVHPPRGPQASARGNDEEKPPVPDDGPKSALELAMERLRKKDKDAGVDAQPVTDAQRAAIAEARSVVRGEARRARDPVQVEDGGHPRAGGARGPRAGVPPGPRADHQRPRPQDRGDPRRALTRSARSPRRRAPRRSWARTRSPRG